VTERMRQSRARSIEGPIDAFDKEWCLPRVRTRHKCAVALSRGWQMLASGRPPCHQGEVANGDQTSKQRVGDAITKKTVASAPLRTSSKGAAAVVPGEVT